MRAKDAKPPRSGIMLMGYAKHVIVGHTEMPKKRSVSAMAIFRCRKVRHKFGAIRCERDDKKFPSKLERRYYDQLKIRQASGEVSFFLCQIPFDLPGGVRYVCDFAVFLADGTVEFVDTKGRDTPLSIAKRKIVEDLYPVEIKIVTKV